MRSIVFVGRRWFDKVNGNTYHTTECILDGEFVGKTATAYGYGEQYVQSGFEYLEGKNLIPARIRNNENGVYEQLWQWKEKHGIAVHSTVADVGRRKDL